MRWAKKGSTWPIRCKNQNYFDNSLLKDPWMVKRRWNPFFVFFFRLDYMCCDTLLRLLFVTTHDHSASFYIAWGKHTFVLLHFECLLDSCIDEKINEVSESICRIFSVMQYSFVTVWVFLENKAPNMFNFSTSFPLIWKKGKDCERIWGKYFFTLRIKFPLNPFF